MNGILKLAYRCKIKKQKGLLTRSGWEEISESYANDLAKDCVRLAHDGEIWIHLKDDRVEVYSHLTLNVISIY